MRAFSLLAALAILVVIGSDCASGRTPTLPARAPAAEPSPSANDGPSSASHVASMGNSDGMTCEDAQSSYVEELDMESRGPADLTAADLGAVLNAGTYLEPCDIPPATQVQICAAVRNGRAVGITVALDPPSASLEICVARQVRALSFPVHPKMDIARVRF